MARAGRYFIDDLPQHVVQRGNNRTAMFGDADDLQRFLLFFRSAKERFGVAVHGYVLMTTHVHLVVTPETDCSLPRMMQSIGDRYVPYFNKRHRRTGTLWEGRYRAFPVETEPYLLRCLRYVELNPVRAGIVERPEQYRWSSYHTNALGHEDPLVSVHPLLKVLWPKDDERCATYRRLSEEPLSDADLASIRDAAHYEWALGGPTFVRDLEAQCHRRAARRPPGPKRP